MTICAANRLWGYGRAIALVYPRHGTGFGTVAHALPRHIRLLRLLPRRSGMDLYLSQPAPHLMPPPAEPASLDAALRRAFDATRDVPVDYEVDPWQFYMIGADQAQAIAWLNARLMEAMVGVEAAQAAYDQWRSVPGWVVVTCLRVDDEQQQDHLKERCLTAMQRVSLSLWSESIRTSWITDLIVENHEFYRIVEIDAEREVAIGILWYGHAEKRA